MNKRWASGFTIVEILVVIVVLSILVAIITVGYGNVRKATLLKAAQSDLQNAATAMERTIQKTNAYPATLPSDVDSSSGITLNLAQSGAEPFYENVTEVQKGVLFANICAELIAEGVGKGVNQGGDEEDYLTGCGNWNHDNMQFTGWVTKKYDTPLAKSTLTNYAQTFTSNDSWNKVAHEGAVKNFYREIVERYERRGGTFPINSFWDSWATPQNGGVIAEALPTDPKTEPYFCIEAQVEGSTSAVWHITQENKLISGSC